MGARCSVLGYTHLAAQDPNTLHLAPYFLPLHRAILSFSRFLVRSSCSYLEAFLSFGFFKLYMLGKLCVSSFQWLWPCNIWSYGHRDMASGKKMMQCWNSLWCFSLKNSYLPIWGEYYRALFMRGSQDLVLQVGSARTLQFLPNRYNLLRKVGPKTICFSWKKWSIY